MDSELDIQMSSTSLGYEKNGGTVEAAAALAEGIISKDRYTELVSNNAQKAESITKEEFPDATFGVSALASAVNAEKLKKDISIGSVDYPYYVNLMSKELFDIKKAEVDRQGRTGISRLMYYAQEYAYAMLQSQTEKDQMNSTVNTAKLIESGTARLRTCIKTLSDEDEIKKMREVNSRLNGNMNVIWAIEPNRGIGDGTLSTYIDGLMQAQRDPKNNGMRFGIDLDLGGLPKEDRSLMEVLDILDNQNLLPVFVSLSGREHVDQSFHTHLPLGNDAEFASKLGEWIKQRISRGQNVPAFVVETKPTEQDVLKDYANFLANLRSGMK